MSMLLTPDGFTSAVSYHVGKAQVTPLFTGTTLMELKDAFTMDRLRKGLNLRFEPLNIVIGLITLRGEELAEPAVLPISRDPDDDIFIALAIAAGADYLVTRDDDLKGDPNVRAHLEAVGVRTVTIREFVEILEQHEGEPTGSPSAND